MKTAANPVAALAKSMITDVEFDFTLLAALQAGSPVRVLITVEPSDGVDRTITLRDLTISFLGTLHYHGN